jgi:phosphoglycolate phosphatase
MPRCDLIVFDWDGTLMDSAAAIVHALQAACRDLGLDEPETARARHVIGLGLRDALQYVVPELPERDYARLSERYRQHYLAHSDEIVLFEGVVPLLEELAARGLLLAVATGKSHAGLEDVLARTGLTARFHATRTADRCFSKPHPQMLEELLEELGVSADRALMIGDTTHDLLMAQNANVAAVGVSYGAHPEAALRALQPRACLDSVPALAEWLLTRV